MIVYNVTTNVSWAIHDDWLQWLKQEHIPRMLETGCFFESRILRLLDIDDEQGPTYALQWHALSSEDYQVFVSQYAASVFQNTNERWGNELIAFSSVMEVLH